MSADAPRVDRPEMPDGYGVPSGVAGLLAWDDVERRLVGSTVYWLATTRPDGRPHVVPRWGVWLDGAFWYDGSPATRHVRNLAGNAACTLHLEDGTRAVIVEGTPARLLGRRRRRWAVPARPCQGPPLDHLPHRRHALSLGVSAAARVELTRARTPTRSTPPR